MRFRWHGRVVAVLAGMLFPVAAMAMDVQISGFGSFIAGKASNVNPAVRDYRSADFEAQPDSLAGVQISGRANEKTSAVVQLVAQGNRNWDAQAEWAYVRYQPRADFSWKAGRISLPLYLYSDSRSVAYGYSWVTLPYSTYNIPVKNVDGFSLIYDHSFGAVDSQLEMFFGASDFSPESGVFRDVPMSTRNEVGLTLEANWQALKFHAGWLRTRLSVNAFSTDALKESAVLVDNLRKQGFDNVADNFLVEDDPLKIMTMAALYDDGHLLGIAECVNIDGYNKSPIPRNLGAYLTLGYHFGDFLYHLTYGRTFNREPALEENLTKSSPYYAAVKYAEKQMAPRNETVTTGVRWDFDSNIAFKLDYSRVRNRIDDTVILYDEGDYGIVRAGINVVF